ncbi:MAG: hypothetical protein ACR652_10250 [Methylocystis sp.]|uniref:hypothetical protein n=1 Tax=Methylocystis sp. TaxID=1911079 RepID=UPI003DA2251B
MQPPNVKGAATRRDAGDDPQEQLPGRLDAENMQLLPNGQPAPSHCAEASIEWRREQSKRRARPDDPPPLPASPAVQAVRVAEVFDNLRELNRYTIAAMCAISARDFNLAAACLADFTTLTRYALKTWDEHEAARKAEEEGAA